MEKKIDFTDLASKIVSGIEFVEYEIEDGILFVGFELEKDHGFDSDDEVYADIEKREKVMRENALNIGYKLEDKESDSFWCSYKIIPLDVEEKSQSKYEAFKKMFEQVKKDFPQVNTTTQIDIALRVL